MIEEKICKGCNETLSVGKFSASKNTKDGYENKCRECRTAQRKKSNGKMACVICFSEFTAAKKQDYCSVECVGESRRLEWSDFRAEVEKVDDESYELLTDYVNTRTKVNILHKICGKEFKVTPSNFKSRMSRCPHCFGNIRWTTAQFKAEVQRLVGSDYVVKGEYINSTTKIKMSHNVCSHSYEVTPDKFMMGRRCPDCNASHGEEFIRNYLTMNGFEFEREKVFEDCRHKRPLPFDFAVYTKGLSDTPCHLIEFDGRQHYQPIQFWGGQEAFEATKLRDSIKDDYCTQRGISLIRIPYFEIDNIPRILDDAI